MVFATLKNFTKLKNIEALLTPVFKRSPPTRLIPEPRAQGFVKSFDGTEIFWELHGPDPATCQERPMVFCYGLACSMSQWRLQLDRYIGCHPCLFLDYRGHHKSEFPSDPRHMNTAALAKDVAAVIEHQKFSKAPQIWAHSLGVSVALELALAQPELCQSLVLCCGMVSNPFLTMFHSDALNRVYLFIKKMHPQNPALIEALWNLSLLKPDVTAFMVRHLGFNPSHTSKKDIRTYVEAVAAVEPRTFFPLLIAVGKGIPEGMLKKIKTPCFIVAGSKDYITIAPTQKAMSQVLRNSTYIEMPMGSHNVQLDFGEYVCMKIEELWRQKHLW